MRKTAIALRQYTIELETLTPVHIGAGGPPLLLNYDAALWRGMVWVFDVERVISERMTLDDIERGADPQINRLLRPEDYPAYARYRLPAPRAMSTQMRDILPLERDSTGHPYLPGSSLKGAIRTALLYWALRHRVESQRPQQATQHATPSPEHEPEYLSLIKRILEAQGLRREWAARDLEQAIFQRPTQQAQTEHTGASSQPRKRFDPNHDLGRALRFSDSAPITTPSPAVEVIGIFAARNSRSQPGNVTSRIFAEVLPAHTQATFILSIDEGLFGTDDGLDESLHAFASPQYLLRASREFAYRLTKLEYDYAFSAQFSAIAAFYAELAQRIKQAPRNEAYLQIGWGTGWHAKTIGPLLKLTQPGQELLAALITRFRLDRGRGSTPFPKTRRYIEQDGQPVLPLGWVRIRIPELANEPASVTAH